MNGKVFLALVVALAGLLLAPMVLAKGPPQKVTISGAGLAPQIELTGDQVTLEALGFMALEDYTTESPEAPEGISGDGYLITRYFETSPGRYMAFDQARYYPDPAGGRGAIYYVGIFNGSSEYDHHWFRPNADNEAVLSRVITDTQQTQALLREWFAHFIPPRLLLIKTEA